MEPRLKRAYSQTDSPGRRIGTKWWCLRLPCYTFVTNWS